MAETLLTVTSARPSHSVSAPPWDRTEESRSAPGVGPPPPAAAGLHHPHSLLGYHPDVCLDTLLSTLRSQLSDTDGSGAASVTPQHPSLSCTLLTLPDVQGTRPGSEGPPHPPGPQASHRARKPALTELTLEAEVPPNLVDPHHRGIPDFLQDIRQDFWRFCP